MVISKTQLQELLKEMGLADAQVVDDKDYKEDEGDKFDRDKIIQDFLSQRESFFSNKYDTSVLPKKLSEQAGLIGSKLRNHVRKLSGNQIKQSDLEGKSDDQVIDSLYEFLSDSKNTNINDLRSEITKLSDAHSAELQELQSKNDSSLKGLKSKYDSIYIIDILKSALKGVIPEGVSYNIDKAADLAYKDLISKAEVSFDLDSRKASLFNKENPALPYLKGTKEYVVSEFAKDFVDEMGIVPKDGRNISAKTVDRSFQQQNNQQPIQNVIGASKYDTGKNAADSVLAGL